MTLTLAPRSTRSAPAPVPGRAPRPPHPALIGARPANAPLARRNDAGHFFIVIAVILLLAIAATVVAAAIILCANAGGVLNTVISLDPWTVKIDCVRL